jgi:ferric-dicitrate binding protein FerR (iron transport regulator)
MKPNGEGAKRGDSTTLRMLRAVSCEEFETSVDMAGSLGDLSERLLAHAEHCERCARQFARRQAFAVLTQRTVRALEQARPAPVGMNFAAIREAAEHAKQARWWRTFGLVGVGLATAVGIAILTTPVVEIGPEKVAAKTLAPAGDKLIARHLAGLEVSRDLLPRVGERVDAGAEGMSFEAFGRHRVELAPGAVMEVLRLDEQGVELELLAGLGTFSVKRATEAEVFRVTMEGVAVSVRGTVFSVERSTEGVRVSVEHGRVAVDRQGAQTAFVSAGSSSLFPMVREEPEGDDSKNEASNSSEIEVNGSKIEVNGSRVEGSTMPAPGRVRARVVNIDVGASRMQPGEDKVDVSNLLGPIMQAVKGQRCVQALAALRALEAKVELPRQGVWMQAYCMRRLGDVGGSRLLFSRYGPSGPWSVPSGDELPPLPD